MSQTRAIIFAVCCLVLSFGQLLLASSVVAQPKAETFVATARELAGQPTRYDPSYATLPYPGGDVAKEVGVCTDLVVRAFRAIGIDLQQRVHEDMRANWRKYRARKTYGQRKPDPNIDHRRVTNLAVFLARKGTTLTTSLADANAWAPGDIVVFDLYDDGGTSHIGIISDKRGAGGLPLVFHHFPPLPKEDNCLTDWTIVGHYRYLP